MKERLLVTIGALVLIAIGFSGCAAGGLAEAGAAGEAAAGMAEAATLGRLAAAGDAAALSRLGVAEGATIGASEAAALGRAATTRATIGLGLAAPLAEEVAVVRAGARVLSYSESFPVARFRDLVVRKPDGTMVGSIRRFGERVTIRNSSGQLVGESIISNSRIMHFTDATHEHLRGYSTFDGRNLKHWIYDSAGRPVYFGSEIVTPRSGTPPETVTIPAAFLAGAQNSEHRNQGNSVSPRTASGSRPTPIFHALLRHDGAILHVPINGRPTLVWSDGVVDLWADNSNRHVVLQPNSPLRFPHSGTIHAFPRSDDARFLYYRPIEQ